MAISLSPAARVRLQDLLICFSVGNLCFLRRWYDLEHLQERALDYYRTGPPNPALLIATLMGAFVLTGLIWLAWRWVERRPTPAKLKLAQCGFLLLMMRSLESVRVYWNTESDHYDWGSNVALLAIETILGAGMLLALAGNTRVVRATRRVALFLTLLFPSLMIDFGWQRLSAEPVSAYEPRASAAMLPVAQKGPGQHVIWVLFDELDQRLAFDLKQPAGPLAELERLRGESFVANRVQQTAERTTLAVPAVLSGRAYTRAELVDARTLRVFAEGSKQGADWHDEPSVFKRARAMGVNAAVVGWHHPYCRVLGDTLVRCVEVPSGHPTPALLRETSAADQGVLRAIPFLFRLQIGNLVEMVSPKSEYSSEYSREQYVQERQQKQYFRIRDLTYATAIDPNIGLFFAHFPLPHPFAIYNGKRHDFTLDRTLTYADNLMLVDRTVGELRRVLEQAGMWRSTTILITADHGLRPDMWRHRQGWTPELERLTEGKQSPLVPFILKLPEEDRGWVYEQPFSNAVSGDLILAILEGQIRKPSDAAEWLDQHTQEKRAALAGTIMR
jgi:hypothetical protein